MSSAVELTIVLSFFFFSLVDMRYRSVPAIELFFLGSVFLGAQAYGWVVAGVVWAFAWGAIRSWPGFLILPGMLIPSAWPVVLVGFGVRRGLVGHADLLAIAGLACLFPWYALVLCLAGLEGWRRLWLRRWVGPVPALPGLLLGLAAYFTLRMLFAA